MGCAVDGDTFDLDSCGGEERVRLLGLDTPEVYLESEADCVDGQYDAGTETCCYGPEASDYLKDLLSGDIQVRLEFDHACADDYGRTLAYAWVLIGYTGEDDTGEESDVEEIFVNEELLRKGYARLYEADTSIRYYQDFVDYQNEARESGLGLWGACYE